MACTPRFGLSGLLERFTLDLLPCLYYSYELHPDAKLLRTGQAQANSSSDGTLTEGTSSTGSNAVSCGKGDGGNGPEANDDERCEDHTRMWAPFLGTSGGDADDVSALGNSVDDGRSEASNLDGELSSVVKDREPERRGKGRAGEDSDVKRAGRYHLVNQLVMASPSRGLSLDAARGDLGRGGIGGQGRGSTLERPGRNGRSRSRKNESRTLSPIPTPGTAGGRIASTAGPKRAVTAAQGNSPAVVTDQRQHLADGSPATAGGETLMSANEAENPASAGNAQEARSPSRPTTAARSAPPLGAPAAERKSPGRSGRLRSNPMSASSSFSTVLAEDDRARYRFMMPNCAEKE